MVLRRRQERYKTYPLSLRMSHGKAKHYNMTRNMLMDISTECKGFLETKWLTTWDHRGFIGEVLEEVEVPGIKLKSNLLLHPYRSSVTFFLCHPPWSLIFSSILCSYVFSLKEIFLSHTWLNWPLSELRDEFRLIPNRGFIVFFVLAYPTFVFSFLFYFIVKCNIYKEKWLIKHYPLLNALMGEIP